MQATTMAADEFRTVTQWIGIVSFQLAKKGEAIVAGEVEGWAGIDVKETGTRLTKADFGAPGKILLKLDQEFCGKAEKARGGIVRTRPKLVCDKHKRLGSIRGGLGVIPIVFAVDRDMACGRPR